MTVVRRAPDTIAGIPRASDARYCTFCAHGRHATCAAELHRCECAEQAHRPDDRVAAAMMLYVRLDLTGDTAGNLADEYRAKTGTAAP